MVAEELPMTKILKEKKERTSDTKLYRQESQVSGNDLLSRQCDFCAFLSTCLSWTFEGFDYLISLMRMSREFFILCSQIRIHKELYMYM